MRWIFSLLVLINLVAAGWLYWQQRIISPQISNPGTDDSSEGRLLLLSEVPQDKLQAVVEKPKAARPPAEMPPGVPTGEMPAGQTAVSAKPSETPATSCLRVTGIGTKRGLDSLSTKIAAINLPILDQGEAFDERQTYWVYIPPLKSRAAANAVLAALAKRKVKDYLLVRSGEFENGISLGLFSQRERAEKRLREIKALHLRTQPAEILTKASTFRSYWLLIQSRNKDEEEKLTALLKAENHPADSGECPR